MCVSLCERECVGWFFLGSVKRSYLHQSSPGQTKGERLVAEGWVDGWMGGWVDGWAEGWVDGGTGGWVGLQKLITDLDMRNGYKGGVRF
jgi:hypothetical protein